MIRSRFFVSKTGSFLSPARSSATSSPGRNSETTTCARSSNGARGDLRAPPGPGTRQRNSLPRARAAESLAHLHRIPDHRGWDGRFWMTDGGALTGINGVQVTGPAESALKDRPHRQGSMERCGRIPRSGRRDGKTARRVELAGTGGTRRSPQTVRQREAGRRGLPSVPIQWKDPVPIRGSRSILSRH